MAQNANSLLKDFLDVQKRKLKEVSDALTNGKDSPYSLNLVMGNEAADLDSQVCALLWSYFKQSQSSNNNNNNKQASSTIYIPLINISKNELKLRRDVVSFYEAKLDKNNYLNYLFFNDDINDQFIKLLITNIKTTQFEVTMVDHNRLSIFQDSLLKDYIGYVIDHHTDENLYSSSIEKARKVHVENGDNEYKKNYVVKKYGSCVTVMIEHLLSIDKNFEFPDEFKFIIPRLIILDTVNMNPNAKKVTQNDINVFNMFATNDIKVKLLKCHINIV